MQIPAYLRKAAYDTLDATLLQGARYRNICHNVMRNVIRTVKGSLPGVLYVTVYTLQQTKGIHHDLTGQVYIPV